MCIVDQRDGQHEEAVGDELARVDPADEEADDGHHAHHHEAGGREHQAGEFGGVAEQGLDELRDEDGGAVEREAEHEHQDEADGEVAALEEREIEDGPVADAELPQLPPDHDDEGDDHGDGEEGDEVRGEPVVLLALVEDELERAEGEAEQAEAEEVELDAALLRLFDLLLRPRADLRRCAR